jgi:hypothetical protein
MWASRDKSVVRSSVTPSAKYCCSGSLPRLANGKTTIDRRGAGRGCAIDVVAATAGVGEGFAGGQSHHAPTAVTKTAAAAAIAVRAVFRRLGGALTGKLVAGRSAIASGRSA